MVDSQSWTNDETRAVHEWLMEQNQDVADSVYALAQDAGSTVTLEEALKKYVTEQFLPPLEPGLAHDLLQAAVNRVRWQELAGRYWQAMRNAATE
jgi:hypothetical protein